MNHRVENFEAESKERTNNSLFWGEFQPQIMFWCYGNYCLSLATMMSDKKFAIIIYLRQKSEFERCR